MQPETLSDREHRVLDAVVRNYILSAAPTGSRFLSKFEEFGLSPATIRNIMSDLAERGFIDQPHTSAGRVPTDKGYRYYVDRVMTLMELDESIKNQIKQAVSLAEPSDLHLVMEATSKALSRVTNQLGVILAPKLSRGIFRHLHIFPMDSHRVLLHLTIDSGFVKTMVCELETDVDAGRLESACRVINERFYGKTLMDMCDAETAVFTDVDGFELGVIRLFVPSIRKMITTGDSDALYAEGETNIMLQPEFFGRERVSAVMEMLEEKQLLLHLFEKDPDNTLGVTITIGGENIEGQLKSFSIVKTKYKVGHMEGCLGVIGPTRMQYPFLVSAVDYTARVLGEMYSK
jgi:heat-inducible transcriptional repressor